MLKKSTSYNAYYKFPPPTYPPIWSSIIWQTTLDDISSCALALGFALAFILNFAFAFAFASATWSSGDPTFGTHKRRGFWSQKNSPFSHLGLFDGSHLGFVLLPHFSSFLVDLAPGRMPGSICLMDYGRSSESKQNLNMMFSEGYLLLGFIYSSSAFLNCTLLKTQLVTSPWHTW